MGIHMLKKYLLIKCLSHSVNQELTKNKVNLAKVIESWDLSVGKDLSTQEMQFPIQQ